MTCELVDDTVHPLGEVRLAASKGLATALGEQQDLAGDVMTMLLATYEDKTKVCWLIIYTEFVKDDKICMSIYTGFELQI